jgi:hypothetical protein
MYGSIYAGPALQESDAPVVRYQDLHRKHAPASAGAPEFGMVAFDGQAQFGDVAFDGQPQIPSSGFGDVAFDGQPQIPSSGFGYTRADAGYGGARVFRDPSPDAKEYVYAVNLQVSPPTVEIVEAPAGKYTGPVTRASNAKAYEAIVALARRSEQEEAEQESELERPRGGGRRQQKREEEDDSFFETLLSSATKGVTRGLKSPARGGFQASGRDIEPVRGGDDKRADESNVGKYALYAVGGLAGLTLLVVGIKAAMGGGESE